MRRLAAVLLSSLALLLLAVPAVATEGTGEGSNDQAAEAFGEGQWDGLLASAAVALVVGLVVFGMSNAGVKDEHVDEHH